MPAAQRLARKRSRPRARNITMCYVIMRNATRFLIAADAWEGAEALGVNV